MDAAARRVSNLFVAVDLIGRGIGRTLLDHLVRLAKAEAAQRLHVASSRNAVSFYERAGFDLDPDAANEEPEITWLPQRTASPSRIERLRAAFRQSRATRSSAEETGHGGAQ